MGSRTNAAGVSRATRMPARLDRLIGLAVDGQGAGWLSPWAIRPTCSPSEEGAHDTRKLLVRRRQVPDQRATIWRPKLPLLDVPEGGWDRLSQQGNRESG